MTLYKFRFGRCLTGLVLPKYDGWIKILKNNKDEIVGAEKVSYDYKPFYKLGGK